MPTERRINIRLTPEEFNSFDIMRAKYGFKWQGLFKWLLQRWGEENKVRSGDISHVISAKGDAIVSLLSEEEIEVANAAIELYRSKDEPLKAVQETILRSYKAGGNRAKTGTPAVETKARSDGQRDTG